MSGVPTRAASFESRRISGVGGIGGGAQAQGLGSQMCIRCREMVPVTQRLVRYKRNRSHWDQQQQKKNTLKAQISRESDLFLSSFTRNPVMTDVQSGYYTGYVDSREICFRNIARKIRWIMNGGPTTYSYALRIMRKECGVPELLDPNSGGRGRGRSRGGNRSRSRGGGGGGSRGRGRRGRGRGRGRGGRSWTGRINVQNYPDESFHMFAPSMQIPMMQPRGGGGPWFNFAP